MTIRAPEMDQAPAASGAWLSYAAAPAFAGMAVITGLPAEAAPATCLGGAGPGFLGGMAWMYLMMCVVHLPPWLSLLARREAAGDSARSRSPQ